MADRDLRIRMLLEAADRISRPLRDIAGGSTRAAEAMRATRDRLREVERAQKDIAGFRELKAGVRTSGEAMRAAQARAQALGRQISQTGNPTRAMTREFDRAREAAKRLEREHQAESRRLTEMRERLRAAGISTNDLVRHERELRDRAARTNEELAEQARRLAQVTERQRRFAAARESFGRGQQVAGNMAAGGAAALGAGYAIARPLVGMIGAAQQFQSGMTDIGQKANLTREQTERMAASLLAAARAANQMPEDLRAGVDTLAGFGLNPQQAADMMRPIGRAATAYKAEITDLSAAAFAAHDNLRVTVADTGRLIDAMAQAGKSGAFEVRDMAQYFPALTAAYQGLGQSGVNAAADLAAAAQITRKGAGDSATAATNLSNLLQKISSPATIKAFQKFGIDLPAALQRAYREGKTPIEAITELTNKALGGNMGKLGFLFEDAQVQQALRPLVQNIGEYRRIRGEAIAAANANTTTDADFAERMRDSGEQTRALKVNATALAIALGTQLLPTVNAVVQKATAFVNRLGAWAQRHPQLTKVIMLTVGVLAALLAIFGVIGIAAAALMGPFILLNAGLVAMGVAGGTASIGLLPILGTIALIIGAIALFVASAYLIYKHWGAISGFFSRLWATVAGIFQASVSAVTGFASQVWDRIKGAFSGGILGVTGLLLEWSPLGILWKVISAGLGALGVKVPGSFSGLGRSIVGGLIGGITGMWSRVTGIFTAAAGILSGLAGNIWGRIKGAFSGGILGVSGLLLEWSPLGILWKVISAALGALGVKVPASFAQFGRNIVMGLVNGIIGSIAAVGKAIGRVASATVNWFKSKLGIHSPSRVFAGLGGFMMQGLTNGIDGGADGPVRRVDNLSRRLTRAIAAGAAVPALALPGAAMGGAPGGAGGASATRAGATYNITINGTGMDAEAIARAVAAEIDKRERTAGAAQRSSLGDRQDDWI